MKRTQIPVRQRIKLTPNDRAELARFRAFLRDCQGSTPEHRAAMYEKHYGPQQEQAGEQR